MNSGKTLYMTYLLYKEFRKGKKIITNYHVNFPHYEINRDFLFFLGERNVVLQNVCFGLDELWIWLDCREAMENKVATYFFLQSSKDDSHIYLTAQNNGQNEKRLKENINMLSVCDRYLYNPEKHCYEKIVSPQRILPKEFWSKLRIKIIEYENRNYYIFSDFLPTGNVYFLKAQEAFSLYDTKQKIRRKEDHGPGDLTQLVADTKPNSTNST